MSLPNSELTASVPDPKNAILGTKMTPRLSIFQDFSSGRCPEVPPGAPGRPRGELDCIYCSGLHAPPRDPVEHLDLPSPGPRPPGDYFKLLFLTLLFYLLASNTCPPVDPHATTLVPRGRRSFGLGGWGWGLGLGAGAGALGLACRSSKGAAYVPPASLSLGPQPKTRTSLLI